MPIYDSFSLIFKNSVIVNSNIKFYFLSNSPMSGDSRLSWRLFLHGGMMPFDIFYVWALTNKSYEFEYVGLSVKLIRVSSPAFQLSEEENKNDLYRNAECE
jgi:hypothetical protein